MEEVEILKSKVNGVLFIEGKETLKKGEIHARAHAHTHAHSLTWENISVCAIAT